MKPPRVIFFTSYLIFFVSPLFSANVSVLIIETGLRNGQPVSFSEMTDIWETGLMDVFFEEGHVVTNAQAFALKKKPGKELTCEIQSYITEAEDTGIDYFVLAYLNYETGTARSFGVLKPADIEFNLFNINPSKCVWTQYIDLGQVARPRTEELNRVKKVVRSLIMHLGDSV
jgi:hypothetical protein